MSWIPALRESWAWGLMAAVPIGIILLYFLKLRRQTVEVPSTYLWAKTIEDLHVNSLLQRLRRSLLLLLQLLAVAFALLALFRPGIRGPSGEHDRIVFLLDSSASMQTSDIEEHTNRFEAARDAIASRIESMTDQQSAMLVTFSDRAQVRQPFTSDRRRLREALSAVAVTNHSTDILGALRAADGLANPPRTSQIGDVKDVQVADAKPANLDLYTDGGFRPVTEFSLGNLIPEYHAVGTPEVKNLAITAFSSERNVDDPEQVDVFATVQNLGTREAESNISLFIDGLLTDAATINLAPGEEAGVPFSAETDEAVTFELQIDTPDDLLVDNRAFAGLTPLRMVSVLVVTPGNAALEQALSTPKAQQICLTEFVSPSFLDSEAYKKRALAGTDDLVIYDRCHPEAMPAASTFFIGSLPTAGWQWASESGSMVVIDLDRSHPLTRFLDLYSLLIFEGRAVAGPEGTMELVSADTGPILAIHARDGYQDLVLGFELVSETADGQTQVNTNWYAERSWPVFTLNVLRYLAGAAEASGAPSYRPGELVRLRLESVVSDVRIERVGGESQSMTLGPAGWIEFAATDQPGNYRVWSGDRLVDMFSINLFDPTESRIAATEEVEIGFDEIEANTAEIEQRHEYWRWMLFAMLGMLAVEWWYFGRRVG